MAVDNYECVYMLSVWMGGCSTSDTADTRYLCHVFSCVWMGSLLICPNASNQRQTAIWALLQRCLDAQSSHSMPLLLCFLLMRQNLSLSLVVVRLLTSIIVDLVIVLGPRAISARAFFRTEG